MVADAAVAEDADAVPDLRPPSPLARVAGWLRGTRDYRLTRTVVLRLLGVVHGFAFLGLLCQGPALIGEHGLTPAAAFLERLAAAGQTFWDVPSLFWIDAGDGALAIWAYLGLALSIAVALGYANLPILLALWAIYGSFVRIGQHWFAFGWEIQILETTLLAAFLAHPWDPRPLRAPPPPVAAIVLMRWLAFRIMLGAGLIKLRGDACWTALTCLDAHFETQPIPGPLSAVFHHLPHPVLAAGVAFNHVAELILPWLAFGPRRLRLVAGVGMAAFQIALILSGNLAFLNWLTLVPILACLDDDFLLRLAPRRLRAYLQRRLAGGPPAPPGRPLRVGRGQLIAVGCFAALVAWKSLPVIDNLASPRQAMNRSYDRLELVNTYGAFGSVTAARHELVIEGTRDADPATAAWSAYELPCQPGDLARRPCVLGPYHRRLDWLIWFAAMAERPSHPWIVHLVWKLLDGDRGIRALLAVDPFDGAPPTWIRIRRFVYHLEPLGAAAWWTRDGEQLWLPPVSREDPELRAALARYGWPSPSLR